MASLWNDYGVAVCGGILQFVHFKRSARLSALMFFLALPLRAEDTADQSRGCGQASVTVFMESPTTGSIDVELPSVCTSEVAHSATAKKKRHTKDAGPIAREEKLRGAIRLPSDCVEWFQEKELLNLEKRKKKRDNSDEKTPNVHATFNFRCEIPLSGSKAWVGLFDAFSRVKTVSVYISTPTGELNTAITDSRNAIVVP